MTIGGEPAGGQDLHGTLERISGQLDEISGQIRQIEETEIPAANRRITKVAVAIGIVAVVVAVAFGVLVAWGTRQGCEAGNRARGEETRLWQRAVPLIVGTPDSPSGRAALASLREQMNHAFAQRDCSWIP